MLSKYTDTYFFTATINNWQKLLLPDNRKEIILGILKYLVKQGDIKLHAYVIMPNHIHLILTNTERSNFQQIQLRLLRYTAKNIIELSHYRSTQADRQIQIWERRPKWIPVINHLVYLQKLEYIHLNSLQEKWQLAKRPELYPWSSAMFYLSGAVSDIITYL